MNTTFLRLVAGFEQIHFSMDMTCMMDSK